VNLLTIYLRMRYPRVRFGAGFRGPLRLRIRGKGQVVFGREVQISNRSGRTALLTFNREARIEIGDRVSIDGAGVMAASAILIGEDAVLGPCLIVDTDFHAVGRDRRRGGETVERRPISIRANALIEGKATILKGVSVGEGAIVRWGSLVASDVAPGAIVMGNPAVPVRRLEA
jgi:maltose O-acetyltransferase